MSTGLKKNHWLKEALCKDQPHLFTSYNPEDVSAAKKICGDCPVQAQCIMQTIEIDGSFISAGTSKYDRLKLKWKRAEKIGQPSFGTDQQLLSRMLRRIR